MQKHGGKHTACGILCALMDAVRCCDCCVITTDRAVWLPDYMLHHRLNKRAVALLKRVYKV
jgi:hypothetical protein